MRCTCCNATLTDYEVTLKHAVSKQFIEICSACLKDTNIPVEVRYDLMSEVDTDLVEDLLDGNDDDFYEEPEDDLYKDMWDER